MKLRDLDLDVDSNNTKQQQLGLPPLEEEVVHPSQHPVLRIFAWVAIFFILFASGYLLFRLFVFSGNFASFEHIVFATLTNEIFWLSVLVGLLAQTVDGALGMAYGITSSSFLMSIGLSPVSASASVHIAEIFTTGASGLMHLKLQNVNYKLFLQLLFPGLLGALIGTVLLTSLDGEQIKPYISLYLMVMGGFVITRIFRTIRVNKGEPRHVRKLALLGGFVDTTGGGGWGPVVTTTLVGTGHDPRTTIGSVNFAEFFLTFASAIMFLLLVKEVPWVVILGLTIGGVFAAPFAAIIVRRLSTKKLLFLVGTIIMLVSAVNFYQSL